MTANEATRRGDTGGSEASTTDQGTGDPSIVRRPADTTPDPAAEPCKKCGHAPDASTIALLRWAYPRVVGAYSRRQQNVDRYCDDFDRLWGDTPRPARWLRSLVAFQKAGLPRNVMLAAAGETLEADHVPNSACFRYFAAICWNRISDMQEEAVDLAYAFDLDGRQT